MLQDGKPDSSNCTLGRVQLNIPTSHVGNAPATVPVKSISAQRHKSQYGRNPSGHCEIGRRAIEARLARLAVRGWAQTPAELVN